MKANSGFTLVEVLIVFGIIAIVGSAGFFYLGSGDPAIRINKGADAIIATLRSAQERAINQEDNSLWGVYLNNASADGPYTIQIFKASTTLLNDPLYLEIPGTSVEQSSLGRGLRFSSPSAGQSESIVFNQRTGKPTTSTIIMVETSYGVSAQVSIAVEESGRITIE